MTQALIGSLCLAIVVAGVFWQAYIFDAYGEDPEEIFNTDYIDENFFSRRMFLPTWLSIASIGFIIVYGAGVLSWNTLVGIDPQATNTIGIDYSILFFLFSLAIVILFKSYLAPFLLSISTSWSVYMWFQYGVFDLIPLFSLVIEYLMHWAPTWLKDTYIVGMLSYITGSSILSTFYAVKN